MSAEKDSDRRDESGAERGEPTGVEASDSSGRLPVRRVLLIAFSGLGALGVGALAGWGWLYRGALAGAEEVLLSARFEDLSGQSVALSSWRGKTRLINFWATWCAPCREEMPDFVQAQQRFADRGLQVIGIAIDRKPAVERFVREIGVNYPILLGDPAWLDRVKTMGNPLGVLPFSLVIGPDDAVLLRRVGKLSLREIERIFA
ncbi:MAG: TlpA family protein disulfide reductase [Casimicrobiaceae bacterium]|nr:TlpA family protein disulfide reductase [Casimicrobiaceae bacterium]